MRFTTLYMGIDISAIITIIMKQTFKMVLLNFTQLYYYAKFNDTFKVYTYNVML